MAQYLLARIEFFCPTPETRVSFIQASDDPDLEYSIIITRLDSHSPIDYLAFARDSALPIGHRIRKKLDESLEKHGYEMKIEESKTSLILILSRIVKTI